jgi:predicted molibdopterin-dependent oxidoreductase YjgC
MVKVFVNGVEVEVDATSTILKAAEKAGVSIPTFCYHPRMDPAGSCRICAVELEDSKRVVMSCVTPVAEGMRILTESAKVADARKTNLELLLLHHPLDCPVCDCGGECPLQNMSFAYGASDSRFESHRNDEVEDIKSDVLVFNSNRCILCGKCVRICDEVQDVHAIGFINRGFDTVIGPPLGKKLDCEFCGDCLEVCPTGAITDKFVRYQYRPWQLEKTKTTCTYCASGCQMNVETEKEAIIRVTSSEGEGPNEGSICAIGRFGFSHVQSTERLDKPYARSFSRLVPTEWDSVIPEIAERIRKIAGTGPDRIATLVSPRITLEDAYLIQGFTRRVLRSNFIDSGARYGFMNAAFPIARATGTLRPMVDHQDLLKAKVILVIGADPTAESNITGLFLKRAIRKEKARMYYVGSESVSITARAKEHIRVLPGGEGLFAWVLSEEIAGEESSRHPEFLAKKEDLFKSFNVDPQAYTKLVQDLRESPTGVIITGRVFHRIQSAFDAMESLIRMTNALGWVEKEGCGILPLPEVGNDLGVLMMGATHEWLPGLLDSQDPENKKKWEATWGEPLSYGKGGGLKEILEGIKSGAIKGLISFGENPLTHFSPNSEVREILSKLDLLVSVDLFQTSLSDQAHFLLPAASSYERSGHVVSVEGFVQALNPAMTYWGESLTDGEIVSRLAECMGVPFATRSTGEVSKEIFTLMPDLSPSTRNGDHFMGPTGNLILPTIVNQPPHKADRKTVMKRMASRAENWKSAITPIQPEIISGEGDFVFALNKSLFHSGKMTLLDPSLMKMESSAFVRINRQTAKKLKIKKNENVLIENSYGSCILPVELTSGVTENELQVPYHFDSPDLMGLFPGEINYSGTCSTVTMLRTRVTLKKIE